MQRYITLIFLIFVINAHGMHVEKLEDLHNSQQHFDDISLSEEVLEQVDNGIKDCAARFVASSSFEKQEVSYASLEMEIEKKNLYKKRMRHKGLHAKCSIQ